LIHYRDPTALELLVEILEISVLSLLEQAEATESQLSYVWNTLLCLLSEEEMNEAINDVLACVADDQSGDSSEVEDMI